jgi:hypothetical protein
VDGPTFPGLRATAGVPVALALRLADNAPFYVPASANTSLTWEFNAGAMSPAAR